MPLPTSTDYRHAIQDPRTALDDDELRHGEVSRDARGLPVLWSGNFASVYRIHCPPTGTTWALKCFTREVTARQERYRHIAAALEAARLPFTVPFVYLERGIQVHGQWYPAVKMEWVEGQTLNRFVEESLEKPKMLRQLLDLWPKLAARLRDAGIAHADLQHGNVLLVPAADGKLALKLIDYDGMYVPALAGTRSGEAGHPNYQHPRRLSEGTYNVHVDRFSHLVIFSAVHCLLVGNRDLWQRFNNGENLLFREQDFQHPEQSKLFRTLSETNDPGVRALVGRLALACKQPLEEVPWLDRMVHGGQVKALTYVEQQAATWLMTARNVATMVPPLPLGEGWGEGGGPQVAPGSLPIHTPEPATPEARPILPAGTLPTIVETPVPLLVGEKNDSAKAPPSILAQVVFLARWFDRLLARLVGEKNTILHGFLRVVAVAALSGGLIMAGVLLFQQGQERAAARKKAAAAVARKKVEEVIERLQAAMGRSDKFAAEEILPELDKLMPTDPRIAKWRRSVAALPEPEEVAVDLGNGVKLEMVLIRAGEFMMGSPDSDSNATGDEKPQHRVRITRPFYLGRYLVTQEQWETVMDSNPSRFKDPRNPVESVSWDDCQQFLQKLNAQFGVRGGKFQLPSEAQWEYACRAGSTTRYCFGDDESALPEYAWYGANSAGTTHPVGGKKPNAWGLYDMHGNAWEWCQDLYSDKYYSDSPTKDPIGAVAGSSRAYRGAHWRQIAGGCRSAARDGLSPELRFGVVGLRVSLVLAEAPTVPLKTETTTPQTIEAGNSLSVAESVEDPPQINVDFVSAKNAQLHGELKSFLRGVDKSRLVAWKAAAEKVMPEAQWLYGCVLANGVQCQKDPEQAVKWFRNAAQQENAEAQFSLGACYYFALGVSKNYGEAVKWFRKAAQQGSALAQFNLGICYDEGQGVTQDYEEAAKWYRKAAERGDAQAQCALGISYHDGHGVPKNDEEAVKWFRKAAEQGDADAQFNLGNCYGKGQGVRQDDQEAAKWYRKAAEQGVPEAQCILGLCYQKGQGVPKNETEAMKWVKKAADQGYAPAQNALRLMRLMER